MVTNTDLFAYLGNPPDSAEKLGPYLAAARSKCRAAGVPDYQNNAQYDMFLLALAGFYYDNRGLTFGGKYQDSVEENAQRMVNAHVLELRYAGEDPETETE